MTPRRSLLASCALAAAESSGAIIDAQRWLSTAQGGNTGFEAGKVKG